MSTTYKNYVLAEIKCAILRARLLSNDLLTIGIALKAGAIDADAAIEHLADCGALRLIAPSSATRAST